MSTRLIVAAAALLAFMLVAAGGAEGRGRRSGKRAKVAQVQPGPAPEQALPGERAPAGIRVECNDGVQSQLCDTVLDMARAVAERTYDVIDPRRVEAVLAKEPALRGCRREDCRVAISEQLDGARLIDITIQNRGRGISGTISIYDPVAKGISGDAEISASRRDEAHIRKAVQEAVEYVVSAQKLTATLKLTIQPEGARLKIDGHDRGALRELRLFLGTHTVRVEKVGFVPQEQTVNLTPAGAQLEFRLAPKPVPVKLEWTPREARVLVDGDPVDARLNVVELTEGRHRVQALAPPGSGYDSLDFEINVKVPMDPVRFSLQRLAQLRVRFPRGYSLQVDNQRVDLARSRVSGLAEEITVALSPGQHVVSAVSWRGRRRSLSTLAVPGSQVDMQLRPAPLWPALLLGGAGIAALSAGAWMAAVDGSPGCAEEICPGIWDFPWQKYLLITAGGAALVAGTLWFAYNAAHHPLFRRAPRENPMSRHPSWQFSAWVDGTGGALFATGRF